MRTYFIVCTFQPENPRSPRLSEPVQSQHMAFHTFPFLARGPHDNFPASMNAALCMSLPFPSVKQPTPPLQSSLLSPPPGMSPPRTPNIFPPTTAAYPSTIRAYCSTCLPTNKPSSRLGSAGNLNNFCHSFSSNKGCFCCARNTFSLLRFCCHAVILACSRAREREW